LLWNGQIPFEIQDIQAKSDGFEINFTQAVDVTSVKKAASYALRSYIYKYQHQYGSPIIELKNLKISAVEVSADKRKVRLVIEGLRQYFIHEFKLEGIRNEAGEPLLHETAYYTLNQIPTGGKLVVQATHRLEQAVVVKAVAVKPTKKSTVISDAEAMALLKKHTCLACHAKEAKVVGPSYADIAKRNYTDKQILALVYKPNPQNWPDYATEMAPMSHVPAGDVLKIATWINGLRNKALLNHD
ncbi:MAG: hypothetical protein RLZZ474_237, partial [Bacteroidota bacterium]